MVSKQWLEQYRSVYFDARENLERVSTWSNVKGEQLKEIIENEIEYQRAPYVILANDKLEPELKDTDLDINYVDYMDYDYEYKTGELWVVDLDSLRPMMKIDVKNTKEDIPNLEQELKILKGLIELLEKDIERLWINSNWILDKLREKGIVTLKDIAGKV